ncbi:PREDICTED: uncharacterized protein LOC104798461 [Tarenaya hassleriana]|uniref:uncharacterized protein LOC104798461 n=1 Tax=Tarenaya hassleriana TaxID=28532 RepID=UPI00053C33A0|nr:PREDICTED: uncharacterized protein LOC104798461 [Tarenaya hassleriana]
MNLSSDESCVKEEESSKPCQSGRADELLEADLSINSNSNSHPNAQEDPENVSKTASVSSPKNSNKSDLTETSSFRNSASAKNEDQVESSLQGDQMTVLSNLIQPRDSFYKGDEAIAPKNNDESRSSEEEVNICDICGDLGREKLLAVCSVCGVGAEHIYCMRLKLDEVPDNWICEDCASAGKGGNRKEEDVEGKEESMNGTGGELHCEKDGKLYQAAKNEVLGSEEEEKGLITNGTAKTDSHIPCENKSKAPSYDQIRSSRKRKAVNTRAGDFSNKRSVRTKTVSNIVSLPDLRNRPVCVHSAIGVGTNARLFPAMEMSSLVSKKSVNYGMSLSRDDDPTMSYNPFNGPNRPGGATPQFHVFPLPYFIWQGRFKLQRNGVFSGFCEGIQAHLSRSASQNTVALSPAFSREILIEETPRSAMWTTQFTENQAAAKNIHIYFFSKDPNRLECGYKNLLQHMIMNDVCLRGKVGGFELLIFSSDKLEDGFQRWNGVPFLWGVFREPKPISIGSSRANGYHQECNSELNRAQIPQAPFESRLVNFFQMARRTFEEGSNLSCNLSLGNSEAAAPNLELSLGVGGAPASASRNIIGEEPSSSAVSSRNPNCSFRSIPFLTSYPFRIDPSVTTEQPDLEEMPRVDTTLSL